MHTTDHDLRRYYAQRALEYERVYAKPERQDDLAALRAWLPGWFAGRRVLEVACGTGYWTPHAAAQALSWCATDINDEVLAVARGKALPHAAVQFQRADAYALGLPRAFDAAFAGFWWSHVPLERAQAWLTALHACLLPGARVVLIDNRYVEGSSTPIARHDAAGNTYQQRRLDDGSQHEVLKNFPGRAQMVALLAAQGVPDDAVQWTEWPHFWACCYEVR